MSAVSPFASSPTSKSALSPSATASAKQVRFALAAAAVKDQQPKLAPKNSAAELLQELTQLRNNRVQIADYLLPKQLSNSPTPSNAAAAVCRTPHSFKKRSVKQIAAPVLSFAQIQAALLQVPLTPFRGPFLGELLLPPIKSQTS